MVKIQLELPEKENKAIQYYMIDNNIIDKRKAIIEIIKDKLKTR